MNKNETGCFFSSLSKNGKKTWEHIKEKTISATPAFKGSLYDKSKTKIMFVGRALNGWEYELNDCSTLESTVSSLMQQTGAFETFVDEKGFGEGPRKYHHKNSKFFRFIKHILENIGESDKGIDATWYSDSKQWNFSFIIFIRTSALDSAKNLMQVDKKTDSIASVEPVVRMK